MFKVIETGSVCIDAVHPFLCIKPLGIDLKCYQLSFDGFGAQLILWDFKYCICIYTQALQYSSLKEADVFSMNQKLLKVLNADTNKYNMSVANKLYGEQTFTFKQVNSVEILWKHVIQWRVWIFRWGHQPHRGRPLTQTLFGKSVCQTRSIGLSWGGR